jgi:hypothetical protein
MGYMPRNVIAVLLGATIVCVSCSQPTSLQRTANVVTSPLKDRVPPPNPTKYASVRGASDWQNPYLTVHANGIQVRQNGVAREAPTMSPDEVVAYLEKLPPIAWPYGLIVGVQESGLRNPGDDIPIRRNREELVRLLEKAGIKADLWPSA